MSDLFGAFWQQGNTLPTSLRNVLEQMPRKPNWQGTAHYFDQALIVAPDEAVASSTHGILAFLGEIRNLDELNKRTGTTNSPVFSTAQLLLKVLEARLPIEELLQSLNGPFVLAYYDLRRKEFHFCRDHLGQKFLFHATIPQYQCTFFADSLPRLTALPFIGHSLNPQAVADYFSLGYIPSPKTIYAAIRKVAPATDDAGNGSATPASHRYWFPKFQPEDLLTWEEAEEKAKALLELSTRRLLALHPEADFMLSGGIDSGTVTGLVSRLVPASTRQALTITFDDNAYDESDLAAGTAKRCGVPLHIHKLTPKDLKSLNSLLENSGEPFADSSLLPTAAATRDTTKKALFTGDGGDEIFGGYRRYQAMLLRHRLPAFLQNLLRLPCRVAEAVLPTPHDNRSRLANLKRSLHSLGLPPIAAYGSFQQIASKKLRDELLATENPQDYLQDWEDLAKNTPVPSPVLRYNALDLMVYLPDDGFRKTNLAAEGTGVSYLCPILDMDVVHFALSLPRTFRFTSNENKRLLRAIGQDFLDPRILTQPKRGFGTPVADWFRNDLAPLARKLADEVSEWDIHKLLNQKAVQEAVSAHLKGKASYGPLLWTLYCLRIWSETSPAS